MTTKSHEPRPDDARARGYWRENLTLLGALLLVWFAVSFGCGILLRPWLDAFSILGVPMGFWFAQAGSIYVFVGLIFFYAWRIAAIERCHGVDDADEESVVDTRADQDGRAP